MTRGDDTAYPFEEIAEGSVSVGLTIRELFAAMAMQGILNLLPNDDGWCESTLAATAVSQADKLIAELNK